MSDSQVHRDYVPISGSILRRTAEHVIWSFVVGFTGLLVSIGALHIDIPTWKAAAIEGITSVLMFLHKFAEERIVEMDKVHG